MSVSPGTQRILILEPDAAARDRIEAVLMGDGFEITSPADGQAPANPDGRRPFDAALLSIDGSESRLASRVKELRSAIGAPVILLVDAADAATAVALLGQGADDYLLRPLHANEVRARLTRILERHDIYADQFEPTDDRLRDAVEELVTFYRERGRTREASEWSMRLERPAT